MAGYVSEPPPSGRPSQGLKTSLPIALPGVLVERLQGIDARLTEIDGALTALVEAGATGLAEPGVAARVSERAALAQERLAAIAGLVADIGTWMQEARGAACGAGAAALAGP